MSDNTRDQAKAAARFVGIFLRWLAISLIIGGLAGLIGSAFHMSVEQATAFRGRYPWLIWLLPLVGVAIADAYRLTGMEHTGTNEVIASIHLGSDIPARLIPLIFLSTTLTHLAGGSAGREGAALQIGGGLGSNIGKLFRLDDKDMRLATLCGMSAVFSALFGTPLTATFFALEVISVGVLYYSGLTPCLCASLAAYGVTRLFGIEATRFAVSAVPLALPMLLKVAVLAAVFAVGSIVFCETMHVSHKLAARLMPNTYLRAAVGGGVIVALTLLMETQDYCGAGMGLIARAIEQGEAAPLAFLLKLIFTAITLACGFKGGEVVPTFFVGAALGCVAGPLLGIPAGFAAALGLAAMFCGNVNCTVAAILLSVELFGASNLVYFGASCAITYVLSGYFGLYSSQKIMYSKIKARFIDIYAR